MDKELLFKSRLPEETLDIPGLGPVRIRGLSRAEAMIVQGASGAEAQERKMLAFGMVDPEITEADAGRWQKACTAGELEPVSVRIAELSGVGPGADKAAYKSVRDESGNGVRLLSSAEAGDDSGSTPDGDEQ